LEKSREGEFYRKTDIMGIVLEGGKIKVEDKITVELPFKTYKELERV
tara:strand:+ start:178 stop:318 length:141 start_codon:yes stop_codon:yes gene_type:complete